MIVINIIETIVKLYRWFIIILRGENMGELIDGMRRYLDKEIFIDNCHAIIINAFTCYEGDFFEVKFISGDKKWTTRRYSAWDSNFSNNLPDLN